MSSAREPDGPDVPLLDASEIAELARYGIERTVQADELLFQAGDASYDLIVILEGDAEILRKEGTEDVVISRTHAGGFVGELNLLTGQRRYLTCRMTRQGRVLVVVQTDLRRIMSARPALAEKIFRELVSRREFLRSGEGARAIRIIGSRYSPEAMSLRAFAEHSRLPHTWVDVEQDDGVSEMLSEMGLGPQDTPVVITPNETLRRPSPAQFADRLGLTYRPTPGYIFDLVVVGSGPAGLAAAVYGASEGLRTVSVDALNIGGQAGASSRIENYTGFPSGISGSDLTARAAVQAMRLGARLNAPCEVVGLRAETGFHVVGLSDGSEIPARAVIVASGARYRRLPVQDLERFEGAGVYYAATDLEARVCDGSSVLIIGGGNSAGQAAIYLSQHNCSVTIAIRRGDLESTMSSYLIERIRASAGIELVTGVEVDVLAGRDHLERVTLRDRGTGATRELECSGLFCFIGASPATSWLGPDVLLDEDGFVLTDRELPAGAAYGSPERLPFETSSPGVFAAGDVRRGSMKRVAAAVWEGSSAVRSVYERLATVA
jgi:thioredoxin reductase (NADPH)